jgi:hypothetical protein
VPIFDQQAGCTTDDAGFDKAKEKENKTNYLFKLVAVPIANEKNRIIQEYQQGITIASNLIPQVEI